MVTISRRHFETVKSDTNLQIIPPAPASTSVMAFQTHRGSVQQWKSCQAFSAAIDRRSLMEVIQHGYGEVTPTLVPQGEWIYNPSSKPVCVRS
jgi:ABC-type transport system substrate-binding protein